MAQTTTKLKKANNSMKKNYVLAIIICVITSNSFCDETFVKSRKQRSVSTTSLKEECATLMADLLEASQGCLQLVLDNCSHSLLEMQKSITKTMRTWISDDHSSLSGASKAELTDKRDSLLSLKKRCQKIRDEITKLGSELHGIKAELKEFEATC